MLFTLEAARALYYRAISEAQADPPLAAVQRARAAHVTVQRSVVTLTQEAIRFRWSGCQRHPRTPRPRQRGGPDAPVDAGYRDPAGRVRARHRRGRTAADTTAVAERVLLPGVNQRALAMPMAVRAYTGTLPDAPAERATPAQTGATAP